MSESSWQEEVGKRAVVSQIIVGALMAGCFVFLAIALATGGGKEGLAWRFTPMSLMLLLFAAVDMAVLAAVPSLVVRNARRAILRGSWRPAANIPPCQRAMFEEFLARTGDAGRLMMVHQTKTVLFAALLEGLALFAIITYLAEGNAIGLVIAIAAMAVILVQMPTRSSMIHWVEDQLRLIEQDRVWEGTSGR